MLKCCCEMVLSPSKGFNLLLSAREFVLLKVELEMHLGPK